MFERIEDDDEIGTVNDLFVDENDHPEYIGVKRGFLGLRSTLIPIEIVRLDKDREALTVPQLKSMVKYGPT